MLDKRTNTFPKKGMLWICSIWGIWRGVREDIALEMSKSLVKSKPFFEITTEMKEVSPAAEVAVVVAAVVMRRRRMREVVGFIRGERMMKEREREGCR